MAAGRYLRLAIPIFAICAITYVLLVLGHHSGSSTEAQSARCVCGCSLQRSEDWSSFRCSTYSCRNQPPLKATIRHCGRCSYEFLGSFMVFAVLAILRSWRLRTWFLGALFIVLAIYGPYFALFVAGILIADLFRQIDGWKSRDLAGAMLCVAGLALSVLSSPHAKYVAAPACLVAGVALCAPVRRLFENRLGNFLGWISFAAIFGAGRCYLFSSSSCAVGRCRKLG